MPRKSNQTEYDDKMSVFKQNPARGESHRRRVNTPRVANPHPAAIVSPSPGYPTPTGASSVHISSGSQALNYWQGPSPPATSNFVDIPQPYPNYEYDTIASSSQVPTSIHQAGISASLGYTNISHPISSTMIPNTPSTNTVPRLVAQLYRNGQTKKIELSYCATSLPSLICDCGAEVRVLYPPSYNVPLEVGALWNFSGQGLWLENSTPRGDGLVSCIKCPYCQGGDTNIGLFAC